MKDKQSDKKGKEAINWEGIRHRLEIAGRVIEGRPDPSPEEKTKILEARAKAFAVEAKEVENASTMIEIVEFFLAHEKYGVELFYVSEVIPLKDITPIPCVSAFVSGIINVRGRILSVVDLKKFFGLPEKGLGDLNKVIILRSGDQEFGILADAILGITVIAEKALQPPPVAFTGIQAAYLKGITADRTAILDAGKILSDEKIVVNEEV